RGVQEAELGERRVEGRHVVPLGEEEVVAVRVGEGLGGHPEDPGVEVDQEGRAGEGGAHEAAAGRRQGEDALAHPEGQVRQGAQGEERGCGRGSDGRAWVPVKWVSSGRMVLSSPRWWRYQLTRA